MDAMLTRGSPFCRAAADRPILRTRSPTPKEPTVVFKRSCAECDVELYCEIGYEDAPEDHVACISMEGGHELYRRYDRAANRACSDPDRPAESKDCDINAPGWRGCDYATGHNTSIEAASSTGACDGICCQSLAYWSGINGCGPTHKVCVRSDGLAALYETTGQFLNCSRTTGEVGSGPGFTGVCTNMPDYVGKFAGCCYPACGLEACNGVNGPLTGYDK
ncbi:hypothetical protein DFJ74DRAFT_679745 [Hyaloraphidium curvatum]|nr:hypothetical protein DFJ74DRAFT_679745 [Hyaloraphidium curvatum]